MRKYRLVWGEESNLRLLLLLYSLLFHFRFSIVAMVVIILSERRFLSCEKEKEREERIS